MHWDTIIKFWFKDSTPQQWFTKDKKFDALIKRRFLKTYEEVVAGETAPWRQSALGRLAEIIVLDQFSRNMFRGSPLAFAHDALALALAQEAIRARADSALELTERRFMYMPFMHSESKKIQKESVRLFALLGDQDTLKYAKDHKAIIDRFGRFPHRNSVLDRKSTVLEKRFLKKFVGF